MKTAINSVLALAAMALAPLGQAAPVTISFSAVVTSASSMLAETGSTLQGTMTFGDASRVDLVNPVACASVTCASYLFDTAPASVDVRLSSASISSSVLGISVYDNTTLFTADGSPADALELGFRPANSPFYILSFTGSPDSFSGSALPDAVAALSQWQSGQFTVWFNAAAGPALQARVTDFRVITSSVPEPATMALFALGAGGVAAATARRRRASPKSQAVKES